METTDLAYNCYSLDLCGICQNAENLDLICTSNISESTGEKWKSCLNALKFIFPDIAWIDDHLFPLMCELCLEKITDISNFKRLCLDTNRKRATFMDPIVNSITETIKIEIIPDDIEEKDIFMRCGLEPEILKFNVESLNEPEIITSVNDGLLETEHDYSLKVETLECYYKDKIPRKWKRKMTRRRMSKTKGRPPKKNSTKMDTLEDNPVIVNDVEESESFNDNIDPNILTEINDANVKISRYQPEFVPTKRERQCRICKKAFSNWQGLKEHVDLNHVKLRRYRCDICHMGFSGQDALNRHVYKHNGTRNYVCAICGHKYITQGDLSEHLERHDAEAKYACELCGIKFKTAGNLKTHASVHTDPKDYKYLCTMCGSKYPTSGGLSVHMQRHRNARHVACTICDKKFYSNTDMTRHLVTHSDQRPFKCELCPCTYKLKHLLLIHKTHRHGIGNYSHKRSRKHDCTYCEKTFTSRMSLLRHIRTHTGVKPFKCRVCNMQFICESYIREHLKRRHTLAVDEINFELTNYFDVCNEVEENTPVVNHGGIANESGQCIFKYDNEETVEIQDELVGEEVEQVWDETVQILEEEPELSVESLMGEPIDCMLVL